MRPLHQQPPWINLNLSSALLMSKAYGALSLLSRVHQSLRALWQNPKLRCHGDQAFYRCLVHLYNDKMMVNLSPSDPDSTSRLNDQSQPLTTLMAIHPVQFAGIRELKDNRDGKLQLTH